MRRRGFTLVEVMIVVAIIALLAAISIPNLLRARLNANEAGAIGGVRTLITAEHSYRVSNSNFTGTLATLSNTAVSNPPYIDSLLGSGAKQGYSYYVGTANNTGFVILANPTTMNSTGVRSFCAAEDGVIYYNSTAAYNTSATSCAGTAIAR